MHELEIESPNTIVDWRHFCRDICAEYFINHPQVIRGPGHVVEIDESCFEKRKFNRGRILRQQQWVLGGVDIQTRQCSLVCVDRRNVPTLISIIQQYILPGTTIRSDEWAAYSALRNDPNYIHRTVNHSVHFLDPTTGRHIQNIENTWMRAKMKQKKQCGVHRSLFDSYL